jgi:transposase
VEEHGIGLPVVMLGLPGFVVLAAGEYGGELELLVETSQTVTGCPGCGAVATPHGRRDHLVRDIPSAGRPVLLVWRKRIWRCEEPRCAKRTWTEATPLIRARAALTERARRWACQRVGRDGGTVEAVRVELGVGWNTVMRAVRDYGEPLVEDPGRLDGVTGLGVDEHVWQHAGRARRTQFATGVVDLTPGRPPRLLDVMRGHRGYKADPLFQIRRLLRRGAEHLSQTNRTKLDAALRAGDPTYEVTLAWHCAQRLRAIYHADDLAAGRRQAERLLNDLPTCPIPEIARLGRTLNAWRTEFLAYFDTDRVSNGPTEAVNLLVEKTRRVGHGYRNFDNYRLRLLLYCGVEWQTPPTPRIRSRRPRLVA